MVALPLIAAVVSCGFALMVTRQFLGRGRKHHLWWAVSLWLAVLGSVSYVITVLMGGNEFFFRMYYLSGAVLMAALLGVGSMYLAFGDRVGTMSLVLVGALGAAAAGAVMAAPADPAALALLDGGSGRGVLQFAGPAAPARIILNVFGTVAVAGVAVKSAVDLARKRAAGAYVAGNVLIAVGVLINAAAGTLARFAETFDPFWLGMTLGWVVMFIGFLRIEAAVGPAADLSTQGVR